MPVDSQHEQYKENLERVELVRDCVKGAPAVKAAGEKYLPHPNKKDPNAKARYEAYVERAQFVNVTGRTLDAMVGMAFRKPSTIELPATLEYLKDDATGEGVPLEQLGKNTVSDLLAVGRRGFLVDYPAVDAKLSQAQTNQLALKASIKTYPAESIINWQTVVINGQVILSMVVLKEKYNTGNGDDFEPEKADQYRVLRLIDNIYTVEVWREEKLVTTANPKGANGSFLNRIPFVFAGAYNNGTDVDQAPLYAIADVNIGQYRNSADYEEGIFLHGQPMLHIDIGTTSASSWNDLNPNGVEVGARRGITTSGGGSAQLLQTKANSAAFEAMSDKKEQMVSLGARLIEPGGQAETAEAARLKHAGDNSVLSNIVQNASSAIEQAIEWCGVFMGGEGQITHEINQDFYDKTLTPQEIMADIQLYDRGLIAKTDIRDGLRKIGRIAEGRTNEDIEDEIEDLDPLDE